MKKSTWAIRVVWGVCIAVGAASADIINVPADQPTIQAGIDAAVDGDEVVVASGTYFEIIDFNGKAIIVRSSAGAAVTIIDATTVPDPGDGKPVVRCDSGEGPGSVLDGFTLTGGTGDTAALGAPIGGGMYNGASSPTVNNCIFDGNVGAAGGGMFNNDASPTVSDCLFTANTVTSSGGGMFNIGPESAPVISNCIFSENHILGSGFGGGIRASDGASATITGCTLIGNTAANGPGGGIYFVSDGTLTMTNCRFIGNSADNSNAGGMFLQTDNATAIVNCVFSGNSAETGAGIFILSGGGSVTVANCTFSANAATNQGGGIMISNAFDTLLTNCVFWANTDAGGMNESAQIHDLGNGLLTANYCDVQGGWTGTGGNNINADPLFVDADGPDNIIGTDDDDARLLDGSPCIDVADFDAYVDDGGPSTDLDGFDRAFDDVFSADTGVGVLTYLDMGPYEYNPTAGGPLIQAHPTSLVTAATGLPVLFTVSAPDATNYQWFRDIMPISDDDNYSGTNTPTLAVIAHADNEDLYSVVVDDGSREENSLPAALAILANPCLADFNEDGDVNTLDFLAFLNAFVAGCP